MKRLKLNGLAWPLFISMLSFAPGKTVLVGGDNIGFALKPGGLIISDTYELKTPTGTYNPSRDSDLRIGDLIVSIGETKIDSLGDLNSSLAAMKEGTVPLGISREGKKLERSLRVYEIKGRLKTGLYVKERVLGIGTLTYYDPDTKTYGALGHEVKESYGTKPLAIESGQIYESEVIGIRKSSDGKVGEKIATLDETTLLGDVIANTEYGIYGHMSEAPSGSKAYRLAKASEVKKGKATVYTVLDGSFKQAFTIDITDLKDPSKVTTKGITFTIDDRELLAKTNGIVSGMSGSPIVQGDKLIGAITHIMVNDCDRGYGVYIEHMFNMLSQS